LTHQHQPATVSQVPSRAASTSAQVAIFLVGKLSAQEGDGCRRSDKPMLV